MATHTPGPWRWLNAITLISDKGRKHAVLTSDDVLQTTDEHGLLVKLTPSHPNARLMAAAPDLLEALKGLVAAVDAADPAGEWDARGVALAAIAKAEGR